MSEFNLPHEILPTCTKIICNMSMREVDSYLLKIESFFRIEEAKIEAKESRLDLIELIEVDIDPDFSRFFVKIDRIAHETNYNLFLKSSAIMIYSAFETTLYSVAQAVSDFTGTKVDVRSYKPASGEHLFRGAIGICAQYLIKVHKVKLDELHETWRSIDRFRIIRNLLVHNGGELDVKNYEDFDKVSSHESGLSREGNLILVEFFYLQQIVGSMKHFFKELCLKFDDRVFIK